MAYKFEWWHLVIVGAIIFLFYRYAPAQTLYGMTDQILVCPEGKSGVCTLTEYRPGWNGETVPITVGKAGHDIQYPAWIRAYLDPLVTDFNNLLNSNNIVVGESDCEIKTTVGRCYDWGCAGLTDSEYPIPSTTWLKGKFVHSPDPSLQGPGWGSLYYYWYHLYDCVLDTPYPIDEVKALGHNDMSYGVTMRIIPVGESGCNTNGDYDCDGCVEDFEILDALSNWVHQTSISDTEILIILNEWVTQSGC